MAALSTAKARLREASATERGVINHMERRRDEEVRKLAEVIRRLATKRDGVWVTRFHDGVDVSRYITPRIEQIMREAGINANDDLD